MKQLFLTAFFVILLIVCDLSGACMFHIQLYFPPARRLTCGYARICATILKKILICGIEKDSVLSAFIAVRKEP